MRKNWGSEMSMVCGPVPHKQQDSTRRRLAPASTHTSLSACCRLVSPEDMRNLFPIIVLAKLARHLQLLD